MEIERKKCEALQLSATITEGSISEFWSATRCVNSKVMRRTFQTADGTSKEVICLAGTLLFTGVAGQPTPDAPWDGKYKAVLSFMWKRDGRWNDELTIPSELDNAISEALGETLAYPMIDLDWLLETCARA